MKSILLIGAGRFGKHIALDLNRLGHQVMAVDINEEKINSILPFVTSAQIGDSTKLEFLKSLSIKNYDVCFVAIGKDFQSSLETTATLKELGAKLVVSRAASEIHSKFLLRNGADEVIYPEKQVAKWASIRYSSDHIMGYIELDETHSIFEVSVPKSWIGMSIGQLDIRKKYKINIIGVKSEGKMTLSVTPETYLTEDITLLVLGEYKSLQKCFKI